MFYFAILEYMRASYGSGQFKGPGTEEMHLQSDSYFQPEGIAKIIPRLAFPFCHYRLTLLTQNVGREQQRR